MSKCERMKYKRNKISETRERARTDKVETLTLEEALHYLTLPRKLGVESRNGKRNFGKQRQIRSVRRSRRRFRSLKTDDVYTITLERALEILKEPKKTRFREKEKRIKIFI